MGSPDVDSFTLTTQAVFRVVSGVFSRFVSCIFYVMPAISAWMGVSWPFEISGFADIRTIRMVGAYFSVCMIILRSIFAFRMISTFCSWCHLEPVLVWRYDLGGVILVLVTLLHDGCLTSSACSLVHPLVIIWTQFLAWRIFCSPGWSALLSFDVGGGSSCSFRLAAVFMSIGGCV